MQFEVQSTAGLQAALKTAQGGDTIVLDQGVYSGVLLKNFHFDGDGVTITSATPGAPAVLADLSVLSSSGLSFSNLEFAVDPAKPKDSFTVGVSSDIHFDSINWHGTLDNDPTADQSGLLIRLSSDVTVTNSEFQQLSNAISYLDSDHVVISGNSFHDIRTDGVHGGGTSFLTIKGNLFTDFRPVGTYHPDAIQIWTTNTTTTTHDVFIQDNVIVRGSGGIVQGIFLGDNTGHLPLQHVVITGNAVIGGMYNGIAVTGINDLEISDNHVVAFSDQKSWIYVDKSPGAVVSHNESFLFNYSKATEIVADHNVTVAAVTDHGALALQTFLATQDDDAAALPLRVMALSNELLASWAPAAVPVPPVVTLPMLPVPGDMHDAGGFQGFGHGGSFAFA